jgi:hypothetical protein
MSESEWSNVCEVWRQIEAEECQDEGLGLLKRMSADRRELVFNAVDTHFDALKRLSDHAPMWWHGLVVKYWFDAKVWRTPIGTGFKNQFWEGVKQRCHASAGRERRGLPYVFEGPLEEWLMEAFDRTRVGLSDEHMRKWWTDTLFEAEGENRRLSFSDGSVVETNDNWNRPVKVSALLEWAMLRGLVAEGDVSRLVERSQKNAVTFSHERLLPTKKVIEKIEKLALLGRGQIGTSLQRRKGAL